MSSLGQSIEKESGCMELRWEGGGQGWEVRKGLKLKGMIYLWDTENVLIDVGDKHNSVSILKAIAYFKCVNCLDNKSYLNETISLKKCTGC